MVELKEVKIASIDPNPFRDGSGGTPPATWETVTEAYGFSEDKLKELQESFRQNGVWAGMHGRPFGARVQLAFGHHRVEAAKRMGVRSIPILLANLSDDQMLQFMAAENSEEYGHDFALGVMNAVEAVVKAYNAGAIHLPKPAVNRWSSTLTTEEKPYTPLTVAAYLGWTHHDVRDPKQLRAADKVFTALNALELIEKGALKRQALKGLGAYQAKELVTLTKRAMEAEERKHEQLQDVLEERAKKAKREGDKNALKRVEERLAEVTATAEKAAVAAGRTAGATVAQFHKESESFSEASRKAAESLGLKKEVRPLAGLKKLDLSAIDDLIEKLDRTLLEEDSRWQKILEMASGKAAGRTFRLLGEALERLSTRAKARAKELEKVRD